MTILRVFIVDDEPPARARLRALLDDIRGELANCVAGEAGDGAEALARIAAEPADVVLADIRMPGMDGIELARHLASLPEPPRVVFVTAYDQYAVTAFDLNAVDYLLKPVRASRLAAALAKASRSNIETLARIAPAARNFLACAERGRVLLVRVADILYFKAELKYVTARTAEREFILEESLAQLEQEFAAQFVRVHRNCLVARSAIAGFERAADGETEVHWNVLVHGLSDRIAVSRRQWSAVKSSFQTRNTEK